MLVWNVGHYFSVFEKIKPIRLFLTELSSTRGEKDHFEILRIKVAVCEFVISLSQNIHVSTWMIAQNKITKIA